MFLDNGNDIILSQKVTVSSGMASGGYPFLSIIPGAAAELWLTGVSLAVSTDAAITIKDFTKNNAPATGTTANAYATDGLGVQTGIMTAKHTHSGAPGGTPNSIKVLVVKSANGSRLFPGEPIKIPYSSSDDANSTHGIAFTCDTACDVTYEITVRKR